MTKVQSAERRRHTKTQNTTNGRKAVRLTTRTVRLATALQYLDAPSRKALALVDALADEWGITRAAVIPRIVAAVRGKGARK